MTGAWTWSSPGGDHEDRPQSSGRASASRRHAVHARTLGTNGRCEKQVARRPARGGGTFFCAGPTGSQPAVSLGLCADAAANGAQISDSGGSPRTSRATRTPSFSCFFLLFFFPLGFPPCPRPLTSSPCLLFGLGVRSCVRKSIS